MRLLHAPAGPASPRVDAVLGLTVVGLAVMLVVVFVRVVQLQVAPGDQLSRHIHDRTTRRAQLAPRGDIEDRRGRLLAVSREGFRLFVDPTILAPPFGSVLDDIHAITGEPIEQIAMRVVGAIEANAARADEGKRPVRFVAIGPMLDDHQVELARRLNLTGVHLERRLVRETPGGPAMASLVGKVGFEHQGLLGAELAFDAEMHGEPGRLDYVRDSAGHPMWVSPAAYRASRPGDALRLTVDAYLQEIAHEELVRGVLEADAAGGRLIMIDPRTGDILAMVDHVREGLVLEEPPARERLTGREIEPDSSGHRFRTIPIDRGRAIHPSMARNRCLEDVYEPGSTFKSFVWASLVELRAVAPDEVFDTHDGAWQTDYGRPIRDVSPKSSLTWMGVLVESSNIGMVQGAARINFKTMRECLVRFGFGQRVNMGLPGESAGLVTPISKWSKYTQTSIASGYEIAVTPLQIVRAFSVFARRGDLAGTLPNLRLRHDADFGPDDEIRVRILPPWVAFLTRDTLRQVGQRLERLMRRRFPAEPPLRHSLFGKSGTAEIPRPDGKGYFNGQYNSSFIAGAPADDPRVVLVVVIDDPGPEQVRTRTHYGSAVAGPVVRRVLRRTLEYMGVPAPADALAAESSDDSGGLAHD